MIDLMLWAAWVVVGGGGILGGVWVAVRVGSLVARVFFRATTPSPSSSDLPTLETMKQRAALRAAEAKREVRAAAVDELRAKAWRYNGRIAGGGR